MSYHRPLIEADIDEEQAVLVKLVVPAVTWQRVIKHAGERDLLPGEFVKKCIAHALDVGWPGK